MIKKIQITRVRLDHIYHDDNSNTYLQWCALSGFMLTHFGHLNTTSPCFKPSFIIFSLVAFPLGMAPYKRKEKKIQS